MEVNRTGTSSFQQVVACRVEHELHLDVGTDVQRHVDVHFRTETLHPMPEPFAATAVGSIQAVDCGPLLGGLEYDEVGGRYICSITQWHEETGISGS